VAHIAFIGLGKMGRPMAANLVRAGYDVRGFDLLPMSRDDAAKEGVSIATSAKETLEGADVVITMLPGGQHVLSAWVDRARPKLAAKPLRATASAGTLQLWGKSRRPSLQTAS
jgi:3-hydroxyisobutyrate dehydrogenase